MARSFHPWTPATRIEPKMDSAIYHPRSGYWYTVVDSGGNLFQVEYIKGAEGKRLTYKKCV